MTKKKIILNISFIISVILIILLSYKINLKNRMSEVWMGPYLSASKNLKFGGEFKINQADIIEFSKLSNYKQDFYVFKKSNNLQKYTHNPIGYAYIIKLANFLIPIKGDQLSIIIFQSLIFLWILFIFLFYSDLNKKQKILFFFLYIFNIFLLRFVTFNFYYFWQIIPAAIIGYLLTTKKINIYVYFSIYFFLPFVFNIRPTIILLLLLIIYLQFKKFSFKINFLLLGYFIIISLIIFQKPDKNFWHTAYIGIGAYKNPYNIYLSDDSAYDFFKKKTGIKINASIGGNYYETDIRNLNRKLLKDKYISILRNSPFLILKNAILNTLMGASLGYLAKDKIINFFIAILGFLFLLTLFYYKKYVWILSILFSIITITPYYPPIPGYIYSMYLLQVLAIINLPFLKN